jgi:6-pyruvoyltetrahydropterin/6-carboxytetrahydropterin synthase
MTFNAAHRVHNPALTDDENLALFGKCNNPNWHGHNYIMEISVKGTVDPRTGYVIDLAQVKQIVQQEIIEQIDHRNINLEVGFMEGSIPTTENIAIAAWRVLRGKLAPATLHRIRLWETENHYVEYFGD